MTRHSPCPDTVDERTRVLADAAGALTTHVNCGGLCRGCITIRARLVAFPCTRVRWARAVQDSLDEPDSTAGQP
jgi:hypothetical protein